MTEHEIRQAFERRAAPGNVFSRYVKCEDLIRKLANRKFPSEEKLMKFIMQ